MRKALVERASANSTEPAQNSEHRLVLLRQALQGRVDAAYELLAEAAHKLPQKGHIQVLAAFSSILEV